MTCNVYLWDVKPCSFNQFVSCPSLWNTLLPAIYDPSLTLTQFCELLKMMLFYRANETLP